MSQHSDPKRTAALLAELRRRKEAREKVDFRTILFGPQRKFIEDKSKFKVACCGRRAGKTSGIGVALLAEAYEHPNSNPVYVCMSQVQAKYTLWPFLQEISDKYKLKLEFKRNSGDIYVPETNSTILVRGAGSRREMEKCRGIKMPGCVIDEAQGFGQDLWYMIDDILTPALMDFDGWLACTGTPSAACAGPFYEMIHEKDRGFTSHHWTVLDNNNLLVDSREWLENYRRKRGWDIDNPTYRREYLGQWVRDQDGMVWKTNRAVNFVPTFPEDLTDDWDFILGVDLGVIDPCAFVVMAASQTLGEAYIVESKKEGEMDPTAAGHEIMRYMAKYDFTSIVADSGGIGRAFFEHWKNTNPIPVKPAEKMDKAGSVSLFNGDLRSGKVKICMDKNRALTEEFSYLQWNDRELAEGKMVYDRAFDSHLSDAALYAFRETRHHAKDWERLGPEKGTAEYVDQQRQATMDYYLDRAERRGTVDPWDDGEGGWQDYLTI